VLSTGLAVAIKLEATDAKKRLLENEYRVYRALAGIVGLPNAYYYGNEGDFNVMVMDMLGKSLEQLFNACGRSFSLKTTVCPNMYRLISSSLTMIFCS
jgi:predicted Ser/Thr protein kinase